MAFLNHIFVPFDLVAAKKAEAQRREFMLGDEILKEPYDAMKIRARAKEAQIHWRTLKGWYDDYQRAGEIALEPDWKELTPDEQKRVCEQYMLLQPYSDARIITKNDIIDLSDKLGWTARRTKQWLERYRTGGLWGLTARFSPTRSAGRREPEGSRIPDLATLTPADFIVIEKRLELMGSLTKASGPVPNATIRERAAEVGASFRTLRYHLRRYRKFGLPGLAPKRRSDRGTFHKLSERVEKMVQGLRLSNPDWSIRQIHETATRKADALDEIAPSPWQVRRIVEAIPDAVKLLADGREAEFRNKYRTTYPMNHDGVVYEIDHCRLDLLAIDQREARLRTTSGEIRPWLTLVLDNRSRYVVAFFIGYDPPNRHTVKALIRRAVISNPGGIPNEIKIDNGKDLVANDVRLLAMDLGIELTILAPHQPQQKGRIERLFGTLNTRLWSTLPGYVNSDVSLRNPNATAELTIRDIQQLLDGFLNEYHRETHESTGVSPEEFWGQHCFAEPIQDMRKLDLLMLTAMERKIGKQGIRFENRTYVHDALGVYVGRTATIRADTMYGAPDEIEVYVGEHHVCTAFALDSEHGQALTREQMAEAIRTQRKEFRQTARTAIAILDEADAEIERRKAIVQQSPVNGCDVSDAVSFIKPMIGEPSPAEQEQISVHQTSGAKPNRKPNLLELAGQKMRESKARDE